MAEGKTTIIFSNKYTPEQTSWDCTGIILLRKETGCVSHRTPEQKQKNQKQNHYTDTA